MAFSSFPLSSSLLVTTRQLWMKKKDRPHYPISIPSILVTDLYSILASLFSRSCRPKVNMKIKPITKQKEIKRWNVNFVHPLKPTVNFDGSLVSFQSTDFGWRKQSRFNFLTFACFKLSCSSEFKLKHSGQCVVFIRYIIHINLI